MKRLGSGVAFSLAMLLVCCAWAFALDPARDTPTLHFHHLKLADGLSNSDVRAIVQDHQGFMWFGTWLGGLDRYDGYTFKVYKHDDQDDGSIAGNTIRTIYVDRTGVLWVATNEGIDRYDRDTDSFVHYRHSADSPTDPRYYRVDAFYEDESGKLWLASFGGLAQLDRTNGRVYAYRPNPNDPVTFSDSDLRSLCLDATTGLLWVSSWSGGVSALDRSTGRFTRYRNIPNDPTSLSDNDVNQIFRDRNGNLWFSTMGGLNRFDPRTHKFIRYLHDPRNPASLSDDDVALTDEDDAGRFWVATNNGLNLMDRTSGTFVRYLHEPDDSSSLSSNVINNRALYEDASGSLWIGMRSTGVDRLRGVEERFTTYRHKPQNSNSPSSNVITGFAGASGSALWIGTEAGLDRFDGKTFTHHLADPNDPRTLSPGPERLAARAPNGTVWTGTYGGGLDRLDGQHVTHFRHDPRNPDSPANNNIGGLVPDTAGGLWIGVHGAGLDYFDGRHFRHFSPNPADPAGLPSAFVRPLLLDRHGMLWSCTDNWGLVRFDTHTRKFTVYFLDPKQPGQGANWTTDIYPDGDSLWVGSPKGLYSFDTKTGQFTRRYTEKDGLANNSIVGILGDALGNIWISTINGLSRFDPKTETFRNYDVFDGLQGNDFSPRSEAKTADGRMFFGGVNGLSAFYPDKVAYNPAQPPVVLTEFELFNKPARVGGEHSPLQKAINVASSIVLRQDQSVFRFQFAALDFTAPQKNRYAYELEGFDKGWQYTDAASRFATYTNLDPGSYTFRVKGSNSDGVWNEQGVALQLTILPGWYQTNWFRGACIAAFLMMIWGIHELRVRQLAAQFNMRLEERVSERTRIARDLHDTLLQSFQGLLLQFKAVSYRLQPGEIKKSLDAAIGEASQAITEGRDTVQGLRASTIEKNDLAEAIRTFGEELVSSANNQSPVAFEVVVEGTRKRKRPFLRDEVYRIAIEALRNAFRHAQADRIEVDLQYGDKAFTLRIRDNGRGIDRDVLSSDGRKGHFGLHGMRERAKLIGGGLAIWSEVDSGTEIELTIPASRAYTRSARGFGWFRKLSHKKTDVDEKVES